MVGDAFKAYGREIVSVFIPVVMVRWSSGLGVTWIIVRGWAINIMCWRIRVARSVIWRWITWLVHFKPYGLSIRLKTHIGTRWWRIARHLVCCLFTFATENNQSEFSEISGKQPRESNRKGPGGRFSKAPETFWARKAFFRSSGSKTEKCISLKLFLYEGNLPSY